MCSEHALSEHVYEISHIIATNGDFSQWGGACSIYLDVIDVALLDVNQHTRY